MHISYSGGALCFHVVRVSVRASVRVSVVLFPRYTCGISLMDFHQTFVSCASWDKDEPLGLGVKRSRSQHDHMRYKYHFAVSKLAEACNALVTGRYSDGRYSEKNAGYD